MRHNATPPAIPIAMLGISHREASVGLREQLILTPEVWAGLVADLRASGVISGTIYLATCNRSEFYVAGDNPEAALDVIQRTLRSQVADDAAGLLDWQRRVGAEAVHHLCRVASSLDSLVLGDTEILAQVRKAYESAQSLKQTDKTLNLVFQTALRIGKGVRTHTSIQQRAASVASLVTQELRQVATHGTIVVLGAGEIAQAVLRNLAKLGPDVVVLNRSEASLAKLAENHQFTAGQLADFAQHIDRAAALVSCLAVERPLLDAATLAAATWGRVRPLAVYDLGVPRNIDPLARTLPGVVLHDMDDLQATVEANRAERAQAAAEAEQYVAVRLEEFLTRWVLGPVAPILELVRGRKSTPPAELDTLLLPYLPSLTQSARLELARQLGPALQQLPEPTRAALLAETASQ